MTNSARSRPRQCGNSAAPVFIVSSGNSGARVLEDAFSHCPDVTTHHEYMVNIIQPMAVRYWMHLTDRSEALKVLGATYGAAIKYAETPIWIDASSKASWVIDLLTELFPNARFIHLVRDGREVVSSCFHNLGAECYDDRSMTALAKYAEGNRTHSGLTPPPPEEKYWWPIPGGHHPDAAAFKSWDHFERIAFHWTEINRTIIRSLDNIPDSKHTRVHLEDLVSQPASLQSLFDFMELGPADQAFEILRDTINANQPQSNLLTDKEQVKFDAIAGPMMIQFGYQEERKHLVNY